MRVWPSAICRSLLPRVRSHLALASACWVGKLVGVFGSAYAVIRLGLADVPRDASLLQFIGVSVLCGIGFTMSLFIGLLAFTADPTLQEEVKIGILAGSTLSAVAGYTLLRFAPCEIRSARSRPAE